MSEPKSPDPVKYPYYMGQVKLDGKMCHQWSSDPKDKKID